MAVGTMLAAIAAALVLNSFWGFMRRYREAKKVGLPILITPVPALNPITWILAPSVFPFMKRLPHPICEWAYYGEPFWQFPDRARTRQRLGPAFFIVGPGPTQLFLSDPAAGEALLARTKQFIKPPLIYESIEIFGPNVDTVNGEAWNRHRRLTTPPFNERNSSLVWQESLGQARGMLESWVEKGEQGVSDTPQDTTKLALHVLTGAGFGQSYDYQVGLTKLPEGHTMSYRDSLAYLLGDILSAIMVVKLPISLNFIPKFERMNVALKEFKQYMVEMVDQERAAIDKRGARDNLMSVLVRAADASKAGDSARNSLTDEEIFGNLFIWNLAGHDTTAGTLSFAMMLLSINPDVQEWIRDEITQVFGDTPTEQWDYEEAFPRLQRCLAVMYETLRLYGPVPSMPKFTADSPQHLAIAGKDYLIPAECYVALNLVSLHSDPTSWGADALTWRPARFVQASGSAERLEAPAGGSFAPWASGPRVCPGKKFAQVEFVAVVACVFGKHRVRPARLSGETAEQVRARVMETVEDSDFNSSPTLKMKHPERVSLVWEPV